MSFLPSESQELYSEPKWAPRLSWVVELLRARGSRQRWRPSPDVRGQDAEEIGELLDRSRHLFSDYVLRRRKWEVGLRG